MRRGARGLLIASAIATVLLAAACEPVTHPVLEVRAPADGTATLLGQSDDGRFTVVRATAADARFPAPGTYRVDRTDGSALALPTMETFEAISADGHRVQYRATATARRALWVEGTTTNQPLNSVMGPDLRFAYVPSGGGTGLQRWEVATGEYVDIDALAPRPTDARFLTTDALGRGVSEDGNVIWYRLYSPGPCVQRFVFIAQRIVHTFPCPQGTMVVSANGAFRIEYSTFGNGGVDGIAEIIHRSNLTGEVVQRIQPTDGSSYLESARISDDGWNVWAVNIRASGTFPPDCTAMPGPNQCTGRLEATELIASSPARTRRLPVDPALVGDSARTLALSPGTGRFAVYATSTLGADVHVADRATDQDEALDLGPSLGAVSPTITADGTLVAHAARTTAGAAGSGWYEHRGAAPAAG